MAGLGPPELLIILLVVLLLFGSTRLPKLARSIGEASKEFKKGVNDGDKGDDDKGVGRSRAVAAPEDDRVTMTKAELDALLAEREAQARRDPPSQA